MTSEVQFVDTVFAKKALAQAYKTPAMLDLTVAQQPCTIIALVGMAFEERIAAGPGVLVVCRGPKRNLATAARGALRHGPRGIISFGVAGGLAPDLKAGDWVVASTVLASQGTHSTDPRWSRRLLNIIGGAKYAPILGVDAPVADPTMKRKLHSMTGAYAVDMESHVMARIAAAHGLVFAAARVVVDAADRKIPPAALCGMGVGGPTDAAAVLRELFRHPSQLSPLARIARDAWIATSEMLRIRRLLGPHFGFIEAPSPAAGF